MFGDFCDPVRQGDLFLELGDCVEVFQIVGTLRDKEFCTRDDGVLYVDTPTLIKVGLDFVDLVRGKKPVLDPRAEAVRVDRVSKLGIGVDVVGSLRRSRQANLDCALKVIKDVLPRSKARTVTFVNHNQVKEVSRHMPEELLSIAFRVKSLVDAKVQRTMRRQIAFDRIPGISAWTFKE